jgi:hypothetical protein
MGIEDLLKENNKILKEILQKLNSGKIQPNTQIAGEVVESLSNFADLPDANSGLIPEFDGIDDDNKTDEIKIVSLGKANIKSNQVEEEVNEEEDEDDLEIISVNKVNKVKKAPKKVVKKAKGKAVKKAKGKAKKQGGGKKPSAYQLFMKKQIPIYKKKNPKKSHKEAFSAVAKLWKKQKN